MKGIPIVFLLVLGLVAASQAWKDYSPEDSEDHSFEETDDQDADLDEMVQDLPGIIDDSMKYRKGAELDDGLQDLIGFSDDSAEYLGDSQLAESQELRGIKDGFIEYPEDVSSYVRSRRGRTGNFRSSMRKDENPMVESVVDDNLTYVTGRSLPDQDRNDPISKTLAEQVLQIMKDINGVYYDYVIPIGSVKCSSSQPSYFIHLIHPPCSNDNDFVVPRSGIKCSSSYPALGRPIPYSSSQLTINMDVIVSTECSYDTSSSINKAVTTASVNFGMSPEPHFIIFKIKVEPETDVDFRRSVGNQNNPLDSILAESRQLFKRYLKKSVMAVRVLQPQEI